MSLTVYYHPVSQPSRSVANFCTQAKIQFTTKEVDVFKGEQKTPEYVKINPLQQIPAIDDNGFHLAESIAILKYLARSRNVDDHWYPKDLKKEAKIDEFMAWFPSTLRKNCLGIVLNKVFYPQMNVPITDPAIFEKALIPIFHQFENYFLKGKYIQGDSVSIADMMAFHEIIEMVLAGYDFKPFPKLHAYLHEMLKFPEVKASCQYLFEMLAKSDPVAAKEWNH